MNYSSTNSRVIKISDKNHERTSVRMRSDDVTETAESERPNITGRPTQVDSVSGEQKDKKKQNKKKTGGVQF